MDRARRGNNYKPFIRLRHLHAKMCWCTPPCVWHALLSLMRNARHLQCVSVISSNDPLLVSAFSYLPCVTVLGADCRWPLSFTTVLEQRSARTEYTHLAALQVGGYAYKGCPGPGTTFELTDGEEAEEEQQTGRQHIMLRPQCELFTAFQRSLSDEHQTVLARWAAGNFRGGDEQLSAAESRLVKDKHFERDDNFHENCPHPHRFQIRFQVRGEMVLANKVAVNDEKDGVSDDEECV